MVNAAGNRMVLAAVLIAALAIAGCLTIPEYEGPNTELTAKVAVHAEGLHAHTMYPNDILWVEVRAAGSDSESAGLGRRKLTAEQPAADILLDVGKAYVLRLSSVEPHFGGFSSCVTSVLLTPQVGETFVIRYVTNKSTCRIATGKSAGGGPYVLMEERAGFVEGQQVGRVTVTPR